MMRTVCWSVKGGSGTTTVTVALALLAAAREPTTIVDLAGDVGPLLGLSAVGPGIQDWFRSGPTVGAEALDHVVVDAGPNLTVLRGHRPENPRSDRLADLRAWLAGRPGAVFVDAGSAVVSSPLLDMVMSDGARSLLITRPCFLALHRATSAPYRPTGVVLLREPERGLDADDVEAAVGVGVVATLDVHPTVARALDSGTISEKLPRAMRRSLAVAA